MLLSQSINTMVMSLDLPADTDLKGLLQDCYDFAIGPMIALLPEEFDDEAVATRIETLIETEGSLDEFEAVRLLDHEQLTQIQAAKEMRVHRSTVSRIISSARRKIAQALVDINILKIEGGCCKVVKGR